MRLGINFSELIPVSLPGFELLLEGLRHPDDYGRLLQLAAESVLEDNDDPTQASKGLLVLEAQERLYEFLVCCCRGILHDFPISEMGELATAAEPSCCHGDTELERLMNIATLLEPLQARLEVSGDNIHSLREDPLYFTSVCWK